MLYINTHTYIYTVKHTFLLIPQALSERFICPFQKDQMLPPGKNENKANLQKSPGKKVLPKTHSGALNEPKEQ